MAAAGQISSLAADQALDLRSYSQMEGIKTQIGFTRPIMNKFAAAILVFPLSAIACGTPPDDSEHAHATARAAQALGEADGEGTAFMSSIESDAGATMESAPVSSIEPDAGTSAPAAPVQDDTGNSCVEMTTRCLPDSLTNRQHCQNGEWVDVPCQTGTCVATHDLPTGDYSNGACFGCGERGSSWCPPWAPDYILVCGDNSIYRITPLTEGASCDNYQGDIDSLPFWAFRGDDPPYIGPGSSPWSHIGFPRFSEMVD